MFEGPSVLEVTIRFEANPNWSKREVEHGSLDATQYENRTVSTSYATTSP